MLYFDNDSNRFLSENEIRDLDFELNLEDLNRNKEDIKEDIISIKSVCSCLENSLKGNIRDVIEDLNIYWGYDINICKIIK